MDFYMMRMDSELIKIIKHILPFDHVYEWYFRHCRTFHLNLHQFVKNMFRFELGLVKFYCNKFENREIKI